MNFWKDVVYTKPQVFQQLNESEWMWRTKITHIPKDEAKDIPESWESMATIITNEQKEELELGVEKPENKKNLENQEALKARVEGLEEQTLNLQEGLSSIYEDRARDQLEVQAAIAALYEKIIELKGE